MGGAWWGTWGPLIVCGDIQMTVEQLQTTGWAQRVGGTIVAPLKVYPPSCASSHTIGFFVMCSDRLHVVADCFVVQGAEARPHRPVRLVLRGAKELPLIKVLKAPKPFLPVPMFGPMRSDAHWQEVEDLPCAARPNAQDGHAQLYAALSNYAETELLQAHDVNEQDGQHYRGKGLRAIIPHAPLIMRRWLPVRQDVRKR